MNIDKNDMVYWWPKIKGGTLPLPETLLVTIPPEEDDLIDILDGRESKAWTPLVERLKFCIQTVIGTPCFLRTGHTSGKHSWQDTCYLADVKDLDGHIARLVEESLMGIPGLPTTTWAVRKMIQVDPLFHAFWRMPIAREFRLFATSQTVEHIQPYWPADAIREAVADDRTSWRDALANAAELSYTESNMLYHLATEAAECANHNEADVEWSVDFLQDHEGKWWLTDMALGEDSFRYDPNAKHAAAE